MSEKLLPCPFCGAEAHLFDIDQLYTAHAKGLVQFRVICDQCMATTEYEDGYQIQDEAIIAWNRRATDSLPIYYVLRRTVGKTTMHYEYDDIYNGWCTEMHWATLWGNADDAGPRKDKIGPCELIPVKLLEAPHES